MSSDALLRRKELVLELLIQLKDVRGHIKKISEDLGDSSESFLGKVYEDHNEKIMNKIDLFNQNVEKVKELNLKITAAINEWYQFTKNEKEISSLFFPVKFYFKRKQVRSKTKDLKKEITSIGIKNRLIREDIQRLESTLEYEATLRLKKDVRYGDYLSHLKIKSQLADELQYLLSTIPDMPIRELNADSLEEAIHLLKARG